MRALFDPARAIGVSFLRQPIGSSDFTAARRHYTYDDVPAGADRLRAARTSASPTTSSRSCRCCARRKQLNPQLKVMATPWSPPAWMKTNDSLVGGRLIDDPRDLRRLRAVPGEVRPGVRRQPACRSTTSRCRTSRRTGSPNGYPGTDMPVAQEAKVIEALGPLLRDREPAHEDPRLRPQLGRRTPTTSPTTPPGEDPETDYPYRAAGRRRPRKWLAGTAYHCYSGDPAAQTALHDAFPDKGIWFTECSGSHGADRHRRRSSSATR